MLSIDELEKKWYHYKMKKLIAPMLGIVAFSSIMGVTSYYVDGVLSVSNTSSLSHLTNVLGVSVESNSTEIISSEKIAVEKTEEKIVQKVEQRQELMLEPVIPVLDFEKNAKVKVVKRTSSHTSSGKKLVKAKANSYLTAKELAVISNVKKVRAVNKRPRETKKMNFQSTNVNYIEAMKSKFLRSKNPREAVLLAKAYYKEKNYKESEKWAFTANKINSSLEDSWLIFAKSKAKLGKKKEALRLLVSYYKKSHSTKAKVLMGQIQTGKI